MGSSFSNISIQKNSGVSRTTVAECLYSAASARGFTPCAPDDADAVFAIFAPEDAAWITVSGDLLEDSEAQLEYARHISEALKSDVLRIFCFDSDYLFLNLLNPEKGLDAWANSGHASAYGVRRRSQFAHWRDAVSNLEHFRGALQRRRIFAEEVLEEIAEDLSLRSEQCYFCGEEIGGDTNFLYLSAPARESEGELPKLELLHRDYNICYSGERMVLSTVNRGGAGRGIEFIISGECIETFHLALENAEVDTRPRGRVHTEPLTFERTALADGTPVFRAALQHARIPKKVPDELPELKRMDREFQNSYVLAFVLKADPVLLERANNPKGILDIEIAIRPLQNPEGGIRWSNVEQRERRRRARMNMSGFLRDMLEE